MATYISTMKFTAHGIEKIGETTKRAAAFKSAAKKAGLKVIGEYWTMGPSDGVVIFEAPDDETATAAMIQLNLKGSVQTSTVRAFTPAEMDKILEKVGK